MLYSQVLEESFANAVRKYDGSEAGRMLLDGLEMAFRGQKQLEVDEAWKEHNTRVIRAPEGALVMGKVLRYAHYDLTVEQALELLPAALPFQGTTRAEGLIRDTPEKNYTICLRTVEGMSAELTMQYDAGNGLHYRIGFLLVHMRAAEALVERHKIDARK